MSVPPERSNSPPGPTTADAADTTREEEDVVVEVQEGGRAQIQGYR
jgi:hypothetical protein